MSNQNEDEVFEDKIDDLQDQIHDLQIDLRDAYKTIGELEVKLSTVEEECEQKISKYEKTLSKEIVSLQQNLEEEQKKSAACIEMMRDSDQKIINVLCLAETIRNKNYAYFETTDGLKLLSWASEELKKMKHTWRL